MNIHLKCLIEIVEVNLKIRYRQTFIGLLWVLCNPLLLFSVQAILFTRILNQVNLAYYHYLLTGLIPWYYLTQTAEMGCNSIFANVRLIENLRIHPFLLVCGLAVENFINFLLVSSILFAFIGLNSSLSVFEVIHFLGMGFLLLILTSLITFTAAIYNVIFKDTKFILHFLFTIFYFMTPTFYYLSNLPDSFRSYILLNPFFWIISLFRTQNPSDLPVSVQHVIGINFLIFTLTTLVCFYSWKKFKNSVYLKL